MRLNRTAFRTGLISPKCRANTEFEKYNEGLVECENMIISPTGGLLRRPGTIMFAPTDLKARIFTFNFLPDKYTLVEVLPQQINFHALAPQDFNSHAQILSVTTTIVENQLQTLQAFTLNHIFYLFVKYYDEINGYPPGFLAIKFNTDENQFEISEEASQYVYPPLTLPITKYLHCTSLTPITFTGAAASGITSDDNGRKLFFTIINAAKETYYASGVISNFNEYEDSFAFSLDKGYEASNFNVGNDYSKFSLEAFTPTRKKYPEGMGLYEGRIFLGKETVIWGSSLINEDLFDFKPGPGAADGIIAKLAAANVGNIRWIAGHSKLFIGTKSGIFIIGSATYQDEAITPLNIRMRLFSNTSSSDMQPKTIMESLFFVSDSKQEIFEIILDQNGIYQARCITLLAEHIFKSGICFHAWQPNPFKIYWASTEDGGLNGCTYLREQGMSAWHHHSFQGVDLISDLEVTKLNGLDTLFFISHRKDKNGQLIAQIEYMYNVLDPTKNDYMNSYYLDNGNHFSNTLKLMPIKSTPAQTFITFHPIKIAPNDPINTPRNRINYLIAAGSNDNHSLEQTLLATALPENPDDEIILQTDEGLFLQDPQIVNLLDNSTPGTNELHIRIFTHLDAQLQFDTNGLLYLDITDRSGSLETFLQWMYDNNIPIKFNLAWDDWALLFPYDNPLFVPDNQRVENIQDLINNIAIESTFVKNWFVAPVTNVMSGTKWFITSNPTPGNIVVYSYCIYPGNSNNMTPHPWVGSAIPSNRQSSFEAQLAKTTPVDLNSKQPNPFSPRCFPNAYKFAYNALYDPTDTITCEINNESIDRGLSILGNFSEYDNIFDINTKCRFINAELFPTLPKSQKLSLIFKDNISQDGIDYTLIGVADENGVEIDVNSNYKFYEEKYALPSIQTQIYDTPPLNWLAGLKVDVCINGIIAKKGIYLPNRADSYFFKSSDYPDLNDIDIFTISIGIPYESYVQTLPLQYGSLAPGNSTVGLKGRQWQLFADLYLSLGGMFGSEKNNLLQIPYPNRDMVNTPYDTYTGLLKLSMPSGIDLYDRCVYFYTNDPFPFNVLSILGDWDPKGRVPEQLAGK